MRASEGGGERANEWQRRTLADSSSPSTEYRPACQCLRGRGDTPDLLADAHTSSQLAASEITGSIFYVLHNLVGYHALSQHEKVIVLGGKTPM